MRDDIVNLFKIMGGFVAGMLLVLAYQHENPPKYTIDWRDEGKIISTSVRDGVFYSIVTDKGEHGSIETDAEEHLKRFTAGKTLYSFYVVKQVKWPGMKTARNIGQIDVEYACEDCGYIVDGGTMTRGAIKW